MKSFNKRKAKAASMGKRKTFAKRKPVAKSKRAKTKKKPLQRPFPIGCSRTFTDYALTICIAR